MAEWNALAPDLKMCVRIYQEKQKGRLVWFSRLAEILKPDLTQQDISKNEDRLMDLGILDKEWKKIDDKWTSCYRICSCAESFIKNIVENLGGNSPA